MDKDNAMSALLLAGKVFAGDQEFLNQTRPDALMKLTRYVSEDLRAGRHPLGPAAWGRYLAFAKSFDPL